ncbi:MAG TPA: hypothetical protein VF624_14660 [Tepidisphaeraceae bacterium]|jgi:hypothetical protein
MCNSRWIAIRSILLAACLSGGCAEKAKQYGRERQLAMPGPQTRVWAVAPVINLSGQRGVDPLLQADLLYQQLQTVQGLTVIPVDKVAQVYAALRIERVQTPEQAFAVIETLGCEGLIVGTVTQFDPYNPPKFGGSLQLFEKPGGYTRPPPPDVRDLINSAAPPPTESLPEAPQFVQVVGMYDAVNGTVRDAVLDYAAGRHEPVGPMAEREYFASMERYAGFSWHTLTEQLLVRIRNGR